MNLSRMAEITGLTLAESRTYRIEYLRRHVKELAENAVWLADDDGALSVPFCQSVFEQLYLEARELRYQITAAKGAQAPGTFTDEMIRQARSYPIDRLIEFNQHGQALAFCHADNHPSLTWHKAKNRATCFPCGKTYNALDVLIQRDGYSFRAAVKQLTM